MRPARAAKGAAAKIGKPAAAVKPTKTDGVNGKVSRSAKSAKPIVAKRPAVAARGAKKGDAKRRRASA